MAAAASGSWHSVFIVAALLVPESDLVIQGVGLNPTRSTLLDFLNSIGAKIRILNVAMTNGELVGDIQAQLSDDIERYAIKFPAIRRLHEQADVLHLSFLRRVDDASSLVANGVIVGAERKRRLALDAPAAARPRSIHAHLAAVELVERLEVVLQTEQRRFLR